ncbi:hypothetical protein K7X08_025746 [Anisodus acutangulus]|uniref:Uncharacterized protein n=1 Tax=Anisodus acutangulus TaxID=402998 RepID=A0A9Q1LAT2_9SOLA|nr:hypothetical protein K7X08_025746 [Anisodus acutangulus]
MIKQVIRGAIDAAEDVTIERIGDQVHQHQEKEVRRNEEYSIKIWDDNSFNSKQLVSNRDNVNEGDVFKEGDQFRPATEMTYYLKVVLAHCSDACPHFVEDNQVGNSLVLSNESPRNKRLTKKFRSNEKAIVFSENISPLDVSIPRKISANKLLHDLVSHNIVNMGQEKTDKITEEGIGDNKDEEDRIDNVLQNLENVYNQGGLYLKSTTKGQKG